MYAKICVQLRKYCHEHSSIFLTAQPFFKYNLLIQTGATMARLIVSQLKKKQLTTGDGDNNRHPPRWASKEIPATNLHKYEDIFVFLSNSEGKWHRPTLDENKTF